MTAAAPIVDPKSHGNGDQLHRATSCRTFPTSRDPFALMRTVPGVLLDQVNVGGNETGQQALVLGKGSRQQDTTWTIDGVEITDMGAPGQSPTYFNFDNFEEIQVVDRGQRHPLAHGRRRHQPGHQARDEPVSRRRPRLLQQRRARELERAGRAEGARDAGDAGDRRSHDPDLRLRVRRRRARSSRTRRGSTRRCRSRTSESSSASTKRDRQDGAAQSAGEGELAGDVEGHDQLPVLQRLQAQGRPHEPDGNGTHAFEAFDATHHQDNAYSDAPAARPVEDRRRSRHQLEHVPVSASTPTTTPGSR